jgi:kumamolisin
MSSKNHIPLKGSEIPIIKKARYKGVVDPSVQIEVSLYLRGKPLSPGLPTLKEMTETPLSQRKQISDEEFENLYGANLDDVEKVKLFARKNGLGIVDFNLTQRWIRLTGTVKDMEASFGVKLFMYEYDGKIFRGYEGPAYISKKLDGIVIGVFGISNALFAVTHMSMRSPTDNVKNNFILAPFFTSSQVARAYHFPTGVTGKGQTIGIVQFGGGYSRECLDRYFGLLNAIEKRKDLKTPFIIPVNCGGDNNPGKDWMFDFEVCGTIEVAGAIANDADQVVYFGNIDKEGENGFLKAVQAAVFDSKYSPSTISINMGIREDYCSDGFKLIMNEWLFRVAAVIKNITICTATGNAGSSNAPSPLRPPPDNLAHVDFPASSPWVLACGGTRLLTDGDSIKNETAWNDGSFLGATGGGVSDFFDCPYYQEKANVFPKSVNDNHIGRGIPDAAGNAAWQSGNLIMNIGGQFGFYGGTSAVAPMWCALVALLNQKLNTQLGFINPILYQIDKDSGAFRDITEGNNQNNRDVPGYSAGPGWDACTGLGTPNGEKLYQVLHKMFQEG